MSELRDNSIADVLGDLSQESVALLREELRLVLTDVLAQGRNVGTSAGFLGGAAALGVGAFGALTTALIAVIERRPSRGALLVAALYGAGAAGLADAGLKRLGQVAPELAKTVQRDVKATAKGARRGSRESPRRKPAAKPKPKRARTTA
jgi:putative superfamily III holin-X